MLFAKQHGMVFLVLVLFCLGTQVWASGGDAQDTLLLFVGEDEDILTIASGREESAWRAPAVASVMERKDFLESHDMMLSEALNRIAGFHIQNTSSGVDTYLRGIPESVLYLYDTVPVSMGSDIPLYATKRIEVVRGPGSVLWGPDAFAGIVNVVPLSGRDLDGAETGVTYQSEDNDTGTYLNAGWHNGSWDGFFSIYASTTEREQFSDDITRFWTDDDTPTPVEDRRGNIMAEAGHNLEFITNLSYQDVFKLSGRMSSSKRPYSISSQSQDIHWKEVDETTSGFIKVEGKKAFGIDAALRFTASLSTSDSVKQVIDKDIEYDERETYGEITYERILDSGDTHFIAGMSYRKGQNNGVTLWDNFLPEFLVDENDAFLPNFDQNDYTTELLSVFTQYQRSIGNIDVILGVRNDEHDSFDDNISYNAGLVWTPRESWVCKTLWGTAYRTPSPKQLFNNQESELEEIQSLSVEISRKIGNLFELSAGGFLNRIKNHVVTGDPYAGVSIPNSQEIKGLEFKLSYSPAQHFSFSAGLTLTDNEGPLGTQLYNDYTIINPDGSIEPHYVTLEYPYDTGPDTIFNLRMHWKPSERVQIFTGARYFSGYQLTYPFAETYEKSKSAWVIDAGVSIRDLFLKGSTLDLSIENVLDADYTLPGTYALEKGDSLSVGIFWRKHW